MLDRRHRASHSEDGIIVDKHSDFFKTAAFAGHSPEKLPWGKDESSEDAHVFKKRLKDTLDELIIKGCINFLSGAARGFDTIAAETVLELREKYPWVSLTLVLPCDNQADKWDDADRTRWQYLVDKADHVLHMASRFDKGCMYRRNHYLIEHSNLLLAAYDGNGVGGTAMMLAYAAEKGRTVLRIPLDNAANCVTAVEGGFVTDMIGREIA